MKLGIIFAFHDMMVQWTRNSRYRYGSIMKVPPEKLICFAIVSLLLKINMTYRSFGLNLVIWWKVRKEVNFKRSLLKTIFYLLISSKPSLRMDLKIMLTHFFPKKATFLETLEVTNNFWKRYAIVRMTDMS